MNQEFRDHLISVFNSNIRFDGRNKDEFREITIETGIAKMAEGSARVVCGDTEVLAGVKMSIGTPFPDTPNDGVLMVNCEMPQLCHNDVEGGPPGMDAIEIARVIDRGIRESHSFDTKKLCIKPGEKVWMVNVDIVPINRDGNLIDVGGLAAMAALQDSRFPEFDGEKVDYKKKTDKKLELDHCPLPITICKVGEEIFVDPKYIEEKAIDSRLTVIALEDGVTFCGLQKGGDGTLTLDDVDQMIDLAFKHAGELRKKLPN